MAGGIFVNQPFHFNPKCVIFGIILMVMYWFLPSHELILLPMLFIIGYIAMAWYDHLYQCKVKLHSGISPIGISTLDSWAKPQIFSDDLKNINYVDDQVLAYRRNINYFHIFGVMLTFICLTLWVNYVYNEESKNHPNISNKELSDIVLKRLIGIRTFIGIFGVLAILFHAYRFFIEQRPMREDDDINRIYSINILHIVIGSFIVYVAINTNIENVMYLGVLGAIAGIYHLYLVMIKN
jgi:hypothetical protein